MYHTATRQETRAMLTLFWLTGGRPAEIMELQKRHITFTEEKIIIKISTKKLGKTGHFMVRNRTLQIKIDQDHPYIQNLKRYLQRIKNPERTIIQMSRRTLYNKINQIGYDALGLSICPYNFRHSRMTLLAEKGASKEQLKRFKGSRTDKSVDAYIHARKIDYDVEVDL